VQFARADDAGNLTGRIVEYYTTYMQDISTALERGCGRGRGWLVTGCRSAGASGASVWRLPLFM